MRLRPLAALLLLAVAQAAAAAENSKLEPPDLGRYLRWGPLRVRPGLQLRNIGYDDNILLRPDERISDFTATLAPRLEGLVRFGDRAFLTFDERLEYVAYLRTSEQNYWNHLGKARLTVPLGRLGLFAEGALDRVEERPIDREDIRPRRDVRRLGGGVILELGWRTELEIAGSRADWSYEDPDPGSTVAERLDRVESSRRLTASYRLLGRTDLILEARRKSFDFDRRPDRDSTERTLLPGMRFGEGGRLTGELKLGWSEVDARDPSVPDFSGVVGEVELRYRLDGRTSMTLGFERRQGFSVYETRRYFRATEAEAGVLRYLNRVLGVEIGGARGRLTFEEGAGVPREDDLERYSAGVRLRLSENALGRKVEYVLRIGRYRRSSNLPGLDNDQTTFGASAVLGY